MQSKNEERTSRRAGRKDKRQQSIRRRPIAFCRVWCVEAHKCDVEVRYGFVATLKCRALAPWHPCSGTWYCDQGKIVSYWSDTQRKFLTAGNRKRQIHFGGTCIICIAACLRLSNMSSTELRIWSLSHSRRRVINSARLLL